MFGQVIPRSLLWLVSFVQFLLSESSVVVVMIMRMMIVSGSVRGASKPLMVRMFRQNLRRLNC